MNSLLPKKANKHSSVVKRRRLELPRHNWHYPLKVARLPIPPPLHYKSFWCLMVPRTGVEPARLAALAPETSASTIPPPGHRKERKTRLELATPTLARLCSTNWAISAASTCQLSLSQKGHYCGLHLSTFRQTRCKSSTFFNTDKQKLWFFY